MQFCHYAPEENQMPSPSNRFPLRPTVNIILLSVGQHELRKRAPQVKDKCCYSKIEKLSGQK